jgi:hypothetical protein
LNYPESRPPGRAAKTGGTDDAIIGRIKSEEGVAMDSVQKEAMAVASQLKRIIAQKLCNEIPEDQYRAQREQLLSNFDCIGRRASWWEEIEVEAEF